MKLWGTKSRQSKISEYLQSVKKLGLDVGAICADITKKLPISDNSFDIVWHAGVIEHFSDAEAQLIINENALADIYHNLPTCDNINQGHLLVTTGEK